jgi:hypothetical protein
MSVFEMKMLRWISEDIKKDKIQNKKICLKIERVLRWFDHVQMRAINTTIREIVSLFKLREKRE